MKYFSMICLMLALSSCAFKEYTKVSETELDKRMAEVDVEIAYCQGMAETVAYYKLDTEDHMFTKCIKERIK